MPLADNELWIALLVDAILATPALVAGISVCRSRHRLTGRKQARKAALTGNHEALNCASDSRPSACFCDTEHK
jgi:hypothetical protein